MCFAGVGSDLNQSSQNNVLQAELCWQGSVETPPSFYAIFWELAVSLGRQIPKQAGLVSSAEEKAEEEAETQRRLLGRHALALLWVSDCVTRGQG